MMENLDVGHLDLSCECFCTLQISTPFDLED